MVKKEHRFNRSPFERVWFESDTPDWDFGKHDRKGLSGRRWGWFLHETSPRNFVCYGFEASRDAIGMRETMWFRTTEEGAVLLDPRSEADDSALMRPVLLTLELLECKNVKLADPVVSTARRRGHRGDPTYRYKVLKIYPMGGTKAQRGKGVLVGEGFELPLHLQRGHVKDYTRGAGLFGKYRGRFYWAAHTRGNPEVGVVDKDYEVSESKQPRAV